jgi:hypothetical protein
MYVNGAFSPGAIYVYDDVYEGSSAAYGASYSFNDGSCPELLGFIPAKYEYGIGAGDGRSFMEVIDPHVNGAFGEEVGIAESIVHYNSTNGAYTVNKTSMTNMLLVCHGPYGEYMSGAGCWNTPAARLDPQLLHLAAGMSLVVDPPGTINGTNIGVFIGVTNGWDSPTNIVCGANALAYVGIPHSTGGAFRYDTPTTNYFWTLPNGSSIIATNYWPVGAFHNTPFVTCTGNWDFANDFGDTGDTWVGNQPCYEMQLSTPQYAVFSVNLEGTPNAYSPVGLSGTNDIVIYHVDPNE